MAMALHTPADHYLYLAGKIEQSSAHCPLRRLPVFPDRQAAGAGLRHEMEVDQSRCDCSRTYPLLCSAGRVECLEDLPHRSITSRPSSNLLFQKAAALHDLVLVMGWINPEGQCHRLSERRTKPNGLYLQRVRRERGFEPTIHKRLIRHFTKTSRTKRGAFGFWLPMKRRAPRIEEAKIFDT
jgi:hypothetical protein